MSQQQKQVSTVINEKKDIKMDEQINKQTGIQIDDQIDPKTEILLEKLLNIKIEIISKIFSLFPKFKKKYSKELLEILNDNDINNLNNSTFKKNNNKNDNAIFKLTKNYNKDLDIIVEDQIGNIKKISWVNFKTNNENK